MRNIREDIRKRELAAGKLSVKIFAEISHAFESY
jgi:hypothetical protein